MSCKLQDGKPDWKAYTLGELYADARRQAELHATGCSDCQEQLSGLRLTMDALAADSNPRFEPLPRGGHAGIDDEPATLGRDLDFWHAPPIVGPCHDET